MRLNPHTREDFMMAALLVTAQIISLTECTRPITLYQFFDQDGSGAIDTKELGNIMRQLGAKLSDAEINLLVQEADVDGDGQVDINEVSEDRSLDTRAGNDTPTRNRRE